MKPKKAKSSNNNAATKKNNNNNKSTMLTLLEKFPRRRGRNSPAYFIGLIILFIFLSVLSALRKGGDERTFLSPSSSGRTSSTSSSNSETCQSRRSGSGGRHNGGTCSNNNNDKHNTCSGNARKNNESCRNNNNNDNGDNNRKSYTHSLNGDGSSTSSTSATRTISTSTNADGEIRETVETTVQLNTDGDGGGDIFSVSVEAGPGTEVEIERMYSSDISVEAILDLDMEVKISWSSTNSNDSNDNSNSNSNININNNNNNINDSNNNGSDDNDAHIRVEQGKDGDTIIFKSEKISSAIPQTSSSFSSSPPSLNSGQDSITVNAEKLLGSSSMHDARGKAIFSSTTTMVIVPMPAASPSSSPTSSTSSSTSFNTGTNKLKQPRYFLTEGLSKRRIKKEVKYYTKHFKTWSQRVILEMMYNQIVGTEVDGAVDIQKEIDEKWAKANLEQQRQQQLQKQQKQPKQQQNKNIIEIDDVVRDAILQFGFVKNPITTEPIYYRKKIDLYGWGDDAVHECDWEGVACGERHYREKMQKHIELENVKKRGSPYVLEYRLRDCFCIEKELWDVWSDQTEDFGDENLNDSDSSSNHPCKCDDGKVMVKDVPDGFVTHIVLDSKDLIAGPLPEDLVMLPFLKKLYIKGGTFIGSIPTKFGSFQNLNDLHLEGFDFQNSGIPKELGKLNHTLESLTLNNCNLHGSIPQTITRLSNLVRLDLQKNSMTGTIPKRISNLEHLSYLDLGKNNLKGYIPSTIGKLTNLRFLTVETNSLAGTLPDEFSKLSKLESLSLSSNSFEGPFQDFFGNHPHLKVVEIAMNNFIGTLPDVGWSKDMEIIDLQGNDLTGTIPKEMLQSRSLLLVDLSQNLFTGTIPSLDYNRTMLSEFYLYSNFFNGNLAALDSLPDFASIGIEDNQFTGKVSERFCDGMDNSEVLQEYPVPFSCTDLIACPPGTFHPDGAANHVSGCMKCPQCSSDAKILECEYIGQTKCMGISSNDYEIVRGDMNADGVLSQREFLRLFYMITGRNSWGEHYSNWRDMNVHACTLTGINCKGGKVTKIDLRGATLCASSDTCGGIPSEISALGESLEVLDLSKSFSQSTNGGGISNIPSSIGMLSKLKILDLSHNLITGIPNEIGNISTLQILNLSKCKFRGSIPSAIWKLESLEKLNLNENIFVDQAFPSEVGQLTNLRELLISVSHLEGTIPPELGNLSNLKNLEFYSNFLVGTIPSSFENFTKLRRMDIFNNQLEGTIDFIPKIPDFEIVHIRMNKFSGTIPEAIGELKKLAWLDLSANTLSGEIPSSLASIPVLKDLHLGENHLQPPIPSNLCQKSQINGGYNAISSCDHIICPMGTFSRQGHAVSDSPCQPCEEEKTTLHIGSNNCLKMAASEYSFMLDALVHKRDYNYNNNKGDECDLDVVVCDKNGNVVGFDIPLRAMDFSEKLFLA